MIHFRPAPKFDTDAAILLITEDQLSDNGKTLSLPREIYDHVLAVQRNGQFAGKEKEIFPLVVGKQVLVLAGAGNRKNLSLTALRSIVRQALLSSFLNKCERIEIVPHAKGEDVVRAVIEGVLIGAYRWNKYKTDAETKNDVRRKTVYLAVAEKREYRDTVTVCEGLALTRDLVNDNADTVTSDYFEKTVRGLVKNHPHASLRVLNKKELTTHGLNLVLAVNKGSFREPKLIIVKYNGGPGKEKYTALVGKGITFDSGGLNVKPSGHIETMRTDMAGAAALAGVLKNALALKLRRNVLFIFALAENAIGADSTKPGDIVKSYSGKTVEIANTDAEGRLVLADAISYAIRNYKPERIIDIATLTGACVVALGHDYTALISNHETLVKPLLKASQKTDDRLWRLPNYPEIRDSVKSDLADIRNLGYPKGTAGTLTAAEFLRQFTEDLPWAHLDIAGTAFMEEKQHLYYGYGATGAGVRLLTEYLRESS